MNHTTIGDIVLCYSRSGKPMRAGTLCCGGLTPPHLSHGRRVSHEQAPFDCQHLPGFSHAGI